MGMNDIIRRAKKVKPETCISPHFEKTYGYLNDYPCLCLWRGFSQIMRTTPLRRTTLHLVQIFLTDALTFMMTPNFINSILRGT